MPVLSKNQVAFKIPPHWASKPPSAMSAADGSRPLLDDSLTNLNWLHNLNIMGEISASTPPTPPASPGPLNAHCPYGQHGTSEYRLNGPMDSDIKNISAMPLIYPLAASRKNNRPGVNPPPDNIDYKTNGDVKPPYSYATLICMAMKANKNKMSLSAIYKWIRENFMYYRRADAGWQNSIRHNLSLNKCFIKVPRSKDEPGKGGFWRLDPTYAEEMADGTFKKRRLSNRPSPKKGMTAAKKEHQGGPPMNNNNNSSGTYFLPPPLALPAAHHANLQSTTPATLLIRNDASCLPALTDEETEAAVAASSLKGDFCWNSVLNEDIEMDGMRYKTVDMDGATIPADYGATYRQMLLTNATNSSITCLSSPALSLDDEDLLVSDASNDLDLTAAGGALVGEWWRLTAADSMTVASDPQGPFALGPMGGSQYDVCGAGAQAAFLGHGWDDVTRPVLDGSLDLEGLIDLDVY